MNRFARIFFLISGAVLGSVTLLPGTLQAQEDPTPRGPDEHVQVRLVQLPILARDPRGNPVTDLTVEDIVVKDGGRKLRIAFLQQSEIDTGPAAGPAVRLYLSVPGETGMANPPAEGPPGRYVILFIDAEHDYRLRKPEAIDDVVRFVREKLEPGTRVAVFAYDGDIHLEQGFSADRERLASAVMRAYDRPPRPNLDVGARVRNLMRELEACATTSGPGSRRGDEQCLKGTMLEYHDQVRPRAEEYFEALDAVIRFAGGLRDRTMVMALSHGIAADPTAELIEAVRAIYGNTEQLATLRLEVGFGEGARVRMDRLLRLALENRVTLHFVDRNPAPSGDFSARLGAAHQPGARPIQAAFTAPQFDLEEMAAHTGGVFLHSADFFADLVRAHDLERGGYLLGYYAERALSPRQLRKVRVKTRRKGVRLLHRRGDFVRPTPPPSLALQLVLGVPLAPSSESGGATFQPFTLVVDPEAFGNTRKHKEDFATTNLNLLLRVKAPDGRTVVESYHSIEDAFEATEPGTDALQMPGWVELPEGTWRLVAHLQHAPTGHTGEAAQEIVVPRGKAAEHSR
jgi:VWFA-related protein